MKAGLNRRSLRVLGSALVWVFIIAIAALGVINDNRIFESATLLTILNGIFLTGVSFFTAVVAIIGYIQAGSWRLLALGAGSVVFGLIALLAGPIMNAYGANISVTIFNVGSLLSAVCYAMAVARFGLYLSNDTTRKKRMLITSITLILILAFTGIIAFFSIRQAFPPFFIQGSGSTPIRQIILGIVIVLFGLTALDVYYDYRQSRTSFKFWFALGLFCISVGFFGVYITSTIGNVLNWVARFAQYTGNLYLLFAAAIGIARSHAKSEAIGDFESSLLQTSGLNYRIINDANPNGIAVVNLQGRIIHWNRRAEHLLGYSSDEAIGSSLVSYIVQTDRDIVIQILELSQEHSVNHKEIFTTDLVARCKDGRECPVGFSISGIWLGRQWIGVATLNDITERQQAEAKISHLASFPYLNPNPVVELDISGHIIYANPGAIKQFPDLIILDCNHPFLADIEKIVRSGEKKQMSIDIKIDGFWFEQTLIFLPEVPSYRIYARDITFRKKAEEELKLYAAALEVSIKEHESFAYSLSHDLRAPLRTLDGFTQAILEDYGDRLETKGVDYLMKVRGAAQHMARVTEDMLKLSNIVRSDMQLKTFDLSSLVGKISKEMREKEPERIIVFSIAPNVIVNGDPALLQIALYNLIENAWKYTAKKPEAKIEFGTFIQDNTIVYFIKDNGSGFDMRYKDKLFQPFQRLHSEKDFPGSGIGLATVHRVIERHGGKIWAESELGTGSTIYFTLGIN